MEALKDKKKVNLLISVGLLGVCAWAIYAIFSSEDFSYQKLKEILLSASYPMVGLIFIDSVIGYYIRAYRWKLLLKASGHNIHTPTLWWSMMYGYMINLGVPRLGEVTRCMSLQKKKEVPFTTSFSTVVIERLTDITILFSLVAIVTYWQYDRYADYVSKHITGALMQKLDEWMDKPLFIIGVAGLIVAIIYFLFFDKKIDKKVNESQFINELEIGLRSIAKLEKPWLYIGSTILIWVSYLLTAYFCFKAVPGLGDLGIEAMFAVLAYGSIARSLPMQGGGVGLYQIAVQQILLIGFAVTATVGFAAGMILWSVQTFMQVLFGVIALYFLFGKKGEKED